MAGGATVAALNAVLRMDASSFLAGNTAAQTALKKTGAETARTSSTLRQMGADLTRNVSLPLAGVGVAATVMATRYEETFAQMQGLAGVPAKDVEKLKASVDSLSGSTARGPNELAQGLYFVASAGFQGAEAMSILETSAKASAAGLGETKVIADLTTSAMSAYAKDNLTAAQATDVLVAAVREGKAEPEEMANALGRVIPLAASLGVEFDQVAGATAAMTKSGLDTNEAVTALRGIMTQVAKPTDEAREALAELGINAEGLRRMIAEEGLLSALQFLGDGFEGNTEAASALFGDVRGLTGFLNLMGQEAASVTAVFDATANSTGNLNDAFKVMSETEGFKAKQAMADLERAGIKVGDIMLPKVASAAGFATSALEKFAEAPPAFQQLTVNVGLAAIAAGPLLNIMGRLHQTGARLAPQFPTIAAGMDRAKNSMVVANAQAVGFGKALGGVTAAAAAGAAAFVVWQQNVEAMKNEGSSFVNDSLKVFHEELAGGNVTIDAAKRNLKAWNDQINDNGTEMNNAGFANVAYKNQLTGINEELQKNIGALQPVVTLADQMATVTGRNADEYFRWLSQVDNATTKFPTAEAALKAFDVEQLKAQGLSEENAVALAEQGNAYADETLKVKEAEKALKDWNDTVKAQFDPLFAMEDALQGVEDQNQAVADAQQRINEAYKDGDLPGVAQATRDLEQAQRGLLGAHLEVDVASRNLTEAVKNGSVSIVDAKRYVDNLAASERISATDAMFMKAQLDAIGIKAAEIDGKQALVTVKADVTQALVALGAVIGQINILGQTVNAHAITNGSQGVYIEGVGTIAPGSLGGFASGGMVGDGWFTVGEQGPELGFKRGSSVEIFSNSQSKSMMGGGNSYTLNVTVGAGADPRAAAREIAEQIRRLERERAT